MQLFPGLFRELKIVIDQYRQQQTSMMGQYLLTGSANILDLPKLADALVGRMRVLTIYPLSASEAQGTPSLFIEQLFARELDFMLAPGK